jgi:hypothetical protein
MSNKEGSNKNNEICSEGLQRSLRKTSSSFTVARHFPFPFHFPLPVAKDYFIKVDSLHS